MEAQGTQEQMPRLLRQAAQRQEVTLITQAALVVSSGVVALSG
jgi:hypothetical protein